MVGKRIWVWDESGEWGGGGFYVVVDGEVARGPVGHVEGKEERWFFRKIDDVEIEDMFAGPGFGAKLLRTCTACRHEECPGCDGHCDVFDVLDFPEDGSVDAAGEEPEVEICCDGECSYGNDDGDPIHLRAFRQEASV